MDVKEFLVTVDHRDSNNTFIVSAKSTKDAIDTVWNEKFANEPEEVCKINGWVPVIKRDIHARSIGSLHNEFGKIVSVH